MKKFNEEKIKQIINDLSQKARDILKDGEKTEKFLDSVKRRLKLIPKIGNKSAYLTSMLSLVAAYIRKDYREIPTGSIIAVIAALIYFMSLADMIPDFIPFLGYVDDLSVLAFVLKMVDGDLKKYEKFKNENMKDEKSIVRKN